MGNITNDYSVDTKCGENNFLCTLFGCKHSDIQEDEQGKYWECVRCKERQYFSTFSVDIIIKD